MTHKLAMRDATRERGRLRSRRTRACARARDVDARSPRSAFPAVLKPVDSGGQRAVFRIESREELERDLAEAVAESPTGEAILEEFVDGSR